MELEDIDVHYELRQSHRDSPVVTHKGYFEFELPGPGELELIAVSDDTMAAVKVEEDGSGSDGDESPAAGSSNNIGTPADGEITLTSRTAFFISNLKA